MAAYFPDGYGSNGALDGILAFLAIFPVKVNVQLDVQRFEWIAEDESEFGFE
ncbi:hypothetical protein C0989_005757 [Termitomyces sp. Mn162]|nr:hypothetical protein C0989_005757 [Termitomyces sp. Mn162]